MQNSPSATRNIQSYSRSAVKLLLELMEGAKQGKAKERKSTGHRKGNAIILTSVLFVGGPLQ
jgi:hypothetical protein